MPIKTINEAQQERDAAAAAWIAAGRPDGGAERERLNGALTALAEAKRAEGESASGALRSAAIDAALSAQATRAKGANTASTHLRCIQSAQAWPRCGQDWPRTARERDAEKWAVAQYGSVENALGAAAYPA